jgi:hypothetical protein
VSRDDHGQPTMQVFGRGATAGGHELTVKEYAARQRVTERTVWTWVRKQAVQVRRTPGGGVRILDRGAAL